MAEENTTRVVVPLGLGEGQAQPTQTQEQPTWAKRSLHNVKLGQVLAARQAEQAESAPMEAAGPNEALHREIGELKQAVMIMAQNQFGGGQERHESSQFDMYNPHEAGANFTQQEGNMGALSTYEQMPGLDDEDFDPFDREQMNALIERRVQAALTPSRRAQSDAAMAEQYNRVVAQFGSDSNFKAVMDEALENCIRDANVGKPVDIEQAYQQASESVSSRPGQRTAHLPSKAKTIKGLGELIDFNHRTGRARPYKSR